MGQPQVETPGICPASVAPAIGRVVPSGGRWRGRRPTMASRQRTALAALREWEGHCEALGRPLVGPRAHKRAARAAGREALERAKESAMGGSTLVGLCRAGHARRYQLSFPAAVRIRKDLPTTVSAPALHPRALDVVGWVAAVEFGFGCDHAVIRLKEWAELLGCCKRTAGTATRNAIALGLVERVPMHEVTAEDKDGKPLGHARDTDMVRLSPKVRALLAELSPGKACHPSDTSPFGTQNMEVSAGGDAADVDSPTSQPLETSTAAPPSRGAPGSGEGRAERSTPALVRLRRELGAFQARAVERLEQEYGRKHTERMLALAALGETRAAAAAAAQLAPLDPWVAALVDAREVFTAEQARALIADVERRCPPGDAARGWCCSVHALRPRGDS